jgi:hypothetical protein
MTLRDDAMMLGALSAFVAAAKDEIDRLKAKVQDELEESGADGAPIRLPDGDKIGKISLAFRGSESLATVTDEAAFTQWVERTYPTEVVTTTRVLGAFQSLLLNRLEDDGDGNAIDTTSGELVPGVAWATKQQTSYLTTRFDPAKKATRTAPEQPGGKERMLSAITSREVDVLGSGPLAVEGGF